MGHGFLSQANIEELGITPCRKGAGAHFSAPSEGLGFRAPPSPSPWGRWRGAALRRTVTDEGSPPPAGLTAPCTDLALLSKFGINAIPCRGYNPSVFSARETSRKASSPYTGEPRFALSSPYRAQGSRGSRSMRLAKAGFSAVLFDSFTVMNYNNSDTKCFFKRCLL